jgi:nucleolar complex protein 3
MPTTSTSHSDIPKMASHARKRKRDDQDAVLKFEKLPRRLKNSAPTDKKLLIRGRDQGWKFQAAREEINRSQELTVSQIVSDPDAQVEEEEEEQDQWGQVNTAKEELARLAALINEDPEEHLAALRSLTQITQSKNFTVKKLAIATQCSVFKDIIPGYRIRPLGDDEAKEKVSKDVKKLRTFEQGMLSIYQNYINDLSVIAKGTEQGHDWATLRSVAISCASSLVLAAPHFNFRSELLRLVLNPLTRNTPGRDYEKCCQTVRQLFREDEEGRSSLEAVTMLTKAMRVKDYQVQASLLDLFLHLRLLSEFGAKGSYDRVDRRNRDGESRESLTAKKIRRMREKKQHKSKRDRKIIKEQKAVAKEFQEADAVVSHEERDVQQAEMLKLVFATYFRILKNRVPHLMGSVLEGLARYAHLINQDFFGDILEALKDLVKGAEKPVEVDEEDPSEVDLEDIRDRVRESLLCNITAFALLQGQDGKAAVTNLHLDLSFFILSLFKLLVPTAMDFDIELGPKSLRLDDPISQPQPRTKVNAKTKSVLLIRCLSSALLPAASLRSVPPIRLAAFTKQLMTTALQLPEKSCQALLGLLAQTSKIHGRSIAALWNSEERRGDGVFDPLKGTVEGSNPFAATVWECELLRLHFSPKVKEALDIILKNIRAVQ